MHRFLLSLITVLIGLAFNASALAWGTQGHQVIASLADRQLTPAARKEINRLLALEPSQTLASISTWADEHRNPKSATWHYVNLPRGTCTYDADRDCQDGKCVVEAINRQMEVLSSNAPDDVRLTALKYMVHLVGDVHQPLHAGHKDDRGGNTYQLQAFMRGSNLHAVWDSGLIKNLDEDTETMTARLAKRPVMASAAWSASGTAQDSCRIVATPGFYPDRLVTMDYVDNYTPVMEGRLVEAGARLAQILNRIGR